MNFHTLALGSLFVALAANLWALVAVRRARRAILNVERCIERIDPR